ncbi:hypothetical protein Gorai_013418, partial [Gossypium raimondii]|nr:hypothetical protein [Gossypium raimondii]
EEEDCIHVFQRCPIVTEIWSHLNFSWVIWTSRNKLIYEDKYSTSWDISRQIKSYISELEGIKERNHRSASGLIVKNKEGRIVEAKSILHENVASPFAAEAYAGLQATRLGIQLGYQTKGEEKYLVGETSRSICDVSKLNRLGYSELKERGEDDGVRHLE